MHEVVPAAAFLLLGATVGITFRQLVHPPAPAPASDSDAEAATRARLHRHASQLALVQQLTADPAWTSWPAYAGVPAARRPHHLMSGPLGGPRAAGGYQRVFHHRGTGEVVVVVHLGRAVAGWPLVVHGGVLASVLDESCGRAAFREWGATGVTARLGLQFRRPAFADRFYVVRCRARREEELPEEERGKRHYKVYVDATLEDAKDGHLCVVAEGIFVGGRGKTRPGWNGLGDGQSAVDLSTDQF
ncbi:hypothetical protein P8C59_009499 [Phyllachora maydis]|uniref:Thioesterase domain-containing protein n=1 Tax=Phyllachora maydis TaxID=1825666 RepID=A0AAD9IE20_9PEZI|nr:hypothetical protein P8C59_009499 [Phyllachora maydis]